LTFSTVSSASSDSDVDIDEMGGERGLKQLIQNLDILASTWMGIIESPSK
jgi:hypothetical protein